MSETWVERGVVAIFGGLARGTNGTFREPRKHRPLHTRPTVGFTGAHVYFIGRSGFDKGNFG